MPDQKARVGRGHQQRVVDACDLARQGTGEHCADHQAEAPVDPAAHQCHQGDHDDRLARRARDRGQAVELTVDDRRAGQGVAGDEDQRHLHGEAEQCPEAAAPVLDHGRQRLAGGSHAGDQHAQGEQGGKDEGRGQVLLYQAHAHAGECVEHRRCLFLMVVRALTRYSRVGFAWPLQHK